jgi:type II secretion system protein D
VNLQFPSTSIFEVLATYEQLTGKKLIRDSNLSGPNLTIMVSKPVSREEAVKLIESSLLLNGYSIVPVDDSTVKVLGPSRAPRTEGLPLYTEADQLQGTGDKVISFFKPLRFISPEDATAVLQGVIQVNAYGSIVPVPSSNALVLTDKTPVILKSLALLDMIDREPAQVVTRFIQLKRANAEKVVESLETMFGMADGEKKPAGGAPVPGQGAPAPGMEGQPPPATTGGGSLQYEDRLLLGKTRFLADVRTNRILVVTRAENIRYLSEVISQLDAAGSFEQPFVRALNYISVNDAFPVLTEMLSNGDEEVETTNTGTQQATPASQFNQGGSTGFGSGTDGSSAGLSRPDRLSDEAMQSPPMAATVGSIQLIGDTTANTVIVYGPPDGKERARQILELLDRRPRQVYIAAVIGQLRVGDNLDYGVSYLVRYQNFQPIRSLIGGDDQSGGAASFLSPRIFPGVDVLPDPESLVSPETFAALSGLTLYGSIADSVDVFARFLETTNRFQTLARPVVYTTNNKKATILSGQRVPVPTQTLTSTTPGLTNSSAVTANIQYQDVVLKLEVIPLINADNEVNLIIAQTNDNIIGTEIISGNEVPVIGTQEVTTSVRVPNGSTIILGGLITDEEDRRTDGVPFFNRIPVVGPVFGGGSSRTREKRELLVMIQPVVVGSNFEEQKASSQEGERTTLGASAHELAARPAEFFREAPPVATPAPSPRRKPWFPWLRPKED